MKLKALSVSQVNNYIKRILQSDPILGNVKVYGEISNVKYHGSGNIFLTLKDQQSKINCFIPGSIVSNLRFTLEDGMKINAIGHIFLYDKNGTYSLNIKDIEIDGEGDLHLAFIKLKEKLSSEGYFDSNIKKQINPHPKYIGIITSETGAAIRDMLTTLKNKNPLVKVIVFPTIVQGDQARDSIANNIATANEKYGYIDTLIIGRGGGSLEELWAFNELIVADAILKSKIPIISAVGHESDVSISDFVADYRAATPTAAAEHAVVDVLLIKSKAVDQISQIKYYIHQYVQQKEIQINQHNMQHHKQQLLQHIQYKSYDTDMLYTQLSQLVQTFLNKESMNLKIYKEVLDQTNPSNVLNKGYSYIENADNHPIASIDDISVNDQIKIVLRDGHSKAIIKHVEKKETSNE